MILLDFVNSFNFFAIFENAPLTVLFYKFYIYILTILLLKN